MKRLSVKTLRELPAEVERFSYDRAAVATGVIHLGVGAFHRAHQALIFERALEGGDLRWGIVGASLRTAGVRDDLVPQDGLYTVAVREGAHEAIQVVGALRDVVVAPEDPAALVARLAHPEVHIVSLTVTEKGYKLDPGTGLLRLDDPDVVADLADLTQPRTAPGFLVAGLAMRRAAGLAPFTVISCDNLPHNGKRLRDAVVTMAGAHDDNLRQWIQTNVAFPATMVDRIVPATVPRDVNHMADALGVEDRGTVKTEPFVQWVIEDRFCGPRPDFETLGVTLTKDVGPWEHAKLRLLNGAHSTLAYLGGLAGIEFVHQATAEPAFRLLVKRLWAEAGQTLLPVPELDLGAYTRALMARFDNPALQHRTHQIAMDGSQKIPQRLLSAAAVRAELGLTSPTLALAVAGWIRWLNGMDDLGRTIVVEDPLAEPIAALLDRASDARERVMAIFSMNVVVPPLLASRADFLEDVVTWLDKLERDGARATVTAAWGLPDGGDSTRAAPFGGNFSERVAKVKNA